MNAGAVSGNATNITGTLAIANGGTNSVGALNNNRIMVSNSGSIVEADAGTSGQYLQSNGVAAPSWSTPLGYTINVQALSSNPVDGQTIYLGNLPRAPTTAAARSKIYIRKAGTIKIAEVYSYGGTAGTSEIWELQIVKNNSTSTSVATVNLKTNERIWTNSSLNIAVVPGDYIEIKLINPTWVTNPATVIFGGYLYIE